MSAFGLYYNEYTNNPSPDAAERFQQKPPPPPPERGRTISQSSKSRTSIWSKCLWISFIIFACICLLVATIVPLVVVLTYTNQITNSG